jgi:hypothetical protein
MYQVISRVLHVAHFAGIWAAAASNAWCQQSVMPPATPVVETQPTIGSEVVPIPVSSGRAVLLVGRAPEEHRLLGPRNVARDATKSRTLTHFGRSSSARNEEARRCRHVIEMLPARVGATSAPKGGSPKCRDDCHPCAQPHGENRGDFVATRAAGAPYA